MIFHRDIWSVLQHPPQADSTTLKMEAVYPPKTSETDLYYTVLNPPLPQKRPPSHKVKKQYAKSQIIGVGDGMGWGGGTVLLYYLLLSATQAENFHTEIVT